MESRLSTLAICGLGVRTSLEATTGQAALVRQTALKPYLTLPYRGWSKGSLEEAGWAGALSLFLSLALSLPLFTYLFLPGSQFIIFPDARKGNR